MEFRRVSHAQEEEHPGHGTLVEGEVLRRQGRGIQRGGGVGAQSGAYRGVQPLVVPDRRVALVEIDLHAAAGFGGNAPSDGL